MITGEVLMTGPV